MGQQTQKKMKIIGTQQFINMNTGEIEDFQVTSVEERDFNFHKVWMKNFINTLDVVGNKKTKLCFWIIDHINRENQLVMTYRQIAQQTGISLETVRMTMKLLLESDFIRKVNMGCYVVNPDVVFKGPRNGRLNVLNMYIDAAAAQRKPLTNEEEIENLQKTIDTLTKKLNAKKTLITNDNDQSNVDND